VAQGLLRLSRTSGKLRSSISAVAIQSVAYVSVHATLRRIQGTLH
jgi:hypothetical protein